MRRRSTKHHPNIAEIVQSAQHLELLEVSSFLRDLFIWGDVHYNACGYELIARDLIADYEKRQVRERNDTSFVHIRQAQ
jgi:hypothetical protein